MLEPAPATARRTFRSASRHRLGVPTKVSVSSGSWPYPKPIVTSSSGRCVVCAGYSEVFAGRAAGIGPAPTLSALELLRVDFASDLDAAVRISPLRRRGHYAARHDRRRRVAARRVFALRRTWTWSAWARSLASRRTRRVRRFESLNQANSPTQRDAILYTTLRTVFRCMSHVRLLCT